MQQTSSGEVNGEQEISLIGEIDLCDGPDELDQVCREIARQYRRKLTGLGAGEDRRKEARVWLAEMSYRLIGKALADELLFQDLIDRIQQNGRGTRGVKGNPTPFQTGLLGIFAHAPTTSLSSAERLRLGSQLQYAWQHLIPPDFVRAFMLDVGVKKAIQNAGTKFLEPRYEGWIVKCLSKQGADFGRAHEFPQAIRKRARAALKADRTDEDDWIEDD